MSTESELRSEHIVADKWDRCVSSFIVKTGLGVGAGIVASVIVFRRRRWPVSLGAGFGLGAAYAECQRIFDPATIASPVSER